jgi:hypothetical protein
MLFSGCSKENATISKDTFASNNIVSVNSAINPQHLHGYKYLGEMCLQAKKVTINGTQLWKLTGSHSFRLDANWQSYVLFLQPNSTPTYINYYQYNTSVFSFTQIGITSVTYNASNNPQLLFYLPVSMYPTINTLPSNLYLQTDLSSYSSSGKVPVTVFYNNMC